MDYHKINCPNCSGGIEFPVHAAGELVDCPHCKKSVRLEIAAFKSKRRFWPTCLLVLAAMSIGSITTFIIVHQKPLPPPLPPKDFTQLKRDLIELNQALQSGVDIQKGLIDQDEFQESVNRLDVDYQLHDPKPQSSLITQVIPLARRVAKFSAQYQEAEKLWSHQAAVQMEVEGQSSDELAYQGGDFDSAMDRYSMKVEAAKLRADEATKIYAAFLIKCTNSVEWKQLEDANKNLLGKPLQACEELAREEKNQNDMNFTHPN